MSEQIAKHIGYKKCKDGKIVMLEILGEHNENRKDIFDKNYAKYRCSKARVLEIYDMHDRSKKFNSAIGIHDLSFEYIVGEIIEPKNDFDSNLEEVCAPGIHYFLTEEPAYFYFRNYELANGSGLYKSWHENGQIWEECTYKNGEIDGPYKSYYENGKIEEECTYKDGILDGSYKRYDFYGRVSAVRTYICGIRFNRKLKN